MDTVQRPQGKIKPHHRHRAYNDGMATRPARKTYFGLAAFITGLLAVLFISANIGVSQLRITPAAFEQWNVFTAQAYCIISPLSFGLGVLALFLKNDSKLLAGLGIAAVTIPFLLIAFQLVHQLAR